MATLRLIPDFSEFLRLLDSEKIEYLLIGGYAVALYGYVRPTKDMDVWVALDPQNIEKLRSALARFGFVTLPTPLFTAEKAVLRMGVPPNRLEILSVISGVDFAECYARRRVVQIEGIDVNVIDYDDLLRNKRASGRDKDAVDVTQLEQRRQKP